ncbi:UNVERIFIED_CONTAM: hypothetical protein LK11_38700 [Mumia flava]
MLATAAPPASAAPPENCVGAIECLYLVSATDGSDLVGGTPLDIVILDTEPSGTGATQAWEGSVQIQDRSGATPQCLRTAIAVTSWADCDNSIAQRWAFEPASGQPDVDGHDVIDTDAWNPWTSGAGSEFFYVRPVLLGVGVAGDACLELGADAVDVATVACDAEEVAQQFRFGAYDGDPDRAQKTQAQKAEVTSVVLGSAFDQALARCAIDKNTCATRLTDDTSGDVLSDWDRIDALTIDARPTPVVSAAGCAAASGPKTIYNGGTEPMSTTIGASATNEYSYSFTLGLSAALAFTYKKPFLEAQLTITASAEYGRTWTESSTVSRDVAWTIPPRRYATAALTTTAVRATGSWRLGESSFHPWETRDAVELSIPYSTESAAGVPDSVLGVFNSWAPKGCAADAPAVLASGEQLSVSNTTAPTGAPIPGDVLEASADEAWWVVPNGDGSGYVPAPGVNLKYQWYRQRGDEEPVAIPGAYGPTYTVTGDDVTDDEILERFGPYHLYIGVTDVASSSRFDSLEYVSVATDAVRAGRTPDSTGPKASALTLSVANPGATATQDTEILVVATADGATPTGTVTIRDGGVPLTTVTLGSDGTARTWVRLAPGVHDLDATYLGDSTVGAAVSSLARTTITRAPTTTALQLPSEVRALAPTAARVTVSGAGGDPSGTVQLYDGGRALGDPVTLGSDGTAEVDLPGFEAVGSHDLSASYAGDATYAPSASAERTVEVGVAPTTTRLAVDGSPTPGGALDLRATVSLGGTVPAGTVPTGTVQFTDGDEPVGAPVMLDGGEATTSIRGLTAGSRMRLRATYVADEPFAGSESLARSVVVENVPSSVALSTSKALIARGDRIVLRSRVRARGVDPRGTVRFFADGRSLGVRRVDSAGIARLRTSDLPAGTVRLSAEFAPALGNGTKGSASPAVRQVVRRFHAKVKASVADDRIRRRDRLVVKGSVVVAERQRKRLTARRVWLTVDGDRIKKGRVRANGSFTIRVSGRELSKGRHVVRVTYVGSARPSVAPGTSRTVVVRRR